MKWEIIIGIIGLFTSYFKLTQRALGSQVRLRLEQLHSCAPRFVRVARSNTLQYVRVTETNMAIKCSHRVRAYSYMDQLRAHSICSSPQKVIRLGHVTHACVMIENILYWKKYFKFFLYKMWLINAFLI